MKKTNRQMPSKSSSVLKLTLSHKDMILLDRYARLNDITKKSAAKKILKDFLAANVAAPEVEAKNQLDLFSSRETDLFDYTK